MMDFDFFGDGRKSLPPPPPQGLFLWLSSLPDLLGPLFPSRISGFSYPDFYWLRFWIIKFKTRLTRCRIQIQILLYKFKFLVL